MAIQRRVSAAIREYRLFPVKHLTSEGVTPLAERYRDRLPLAADAKIVSLGEGSTPLLPAPRLSERTGAEVWLKWEGANPTGSFKDRGMTVAVTQALADGARSVVCASTGNTAASAAAYAARAGLDAVILQPEGAVARGKLAQARAVGAKVETRANFEEALAEAKELEAAGTHVLVNSLNPLRLQGQKTAAFEIAEELGGAPDVLALPYGGGGNLCAYALGFGELGTLPRFVAAQAANRGRNGSLRDPNRRACARGGSAARAGRLGRRGAVDSRRGDPRRLARSRPRRGPLLRALVCRRPGGPPRRPAARGQSRLRDHRARPQGPGRGRMKIHVRAPATTANIGPGFDCVAAALDLWNELEVEEGDGELDESHLGVQAFSRLAPVDGQALRVHEPDPARARPRLERGGDRARTGRGRPRRGPRAGP